MKRIGVVLCFALAILFSFNLVYASNCTSFTYSNWSSCSGGTQTRIVANSTPINCTGGSPILIQNCSSSTPNVSVTNLSRIDKGFSCLETEVKSDCSGVKNVAEAAFTILASPQNVADDCVTKLKTYERGGICFGTSSSCDIKETALAVLALNHVRGDTKKYQDWLLNRTRIATDVIWFMQQDSDSAVSCQVNYDSQQFSFSVQDNKKIDINAGNCLSLTNSNYWYLVSPDCYDTEFTLVCDKDFRANLMYKQPNSPTLYVLSDTKFAGPAGTISLKVKSYCFGENSCDFESSAWAALALDTVGKDVKDYLPYLIASEDANKGFLPAAFLQLLDDFTEYGNKLIQLQTFNYWEAENTAHDKYYDTSLALLALSDSSTVQQVKNARDWLLNLGQGANGCWNDDDITDTAFALWALQKRTSTYIITNPIEIVSCVESSFFCIATSECPSDQLRNSYSCTGVGKKCCATENIKTCEEYFGVVCGSGKVCDGLTKRSSDATECCTSQCIVPEPETTACDQSNGVCKSQCSSNQEDIGEDCGDATLSCCKTKAVEPRGSLWWLWLLLVILIILIVLAIIFRDKIKVYIYQKKTGFKKEDGNNTNNNPFGGQGPPGRPPMGGMPISRRPGPPMMGRPPQQRPPFQPQPTRPGQPPQFPPRR